MSANNVLDSLRREIDAIDGTLHDLLIRRAEVVERIRRTKRDGGAHLRPGREAEILRNLVARHKGLIPKQSVVRIWREILAAFVRLQGPFSVAVFEPENQCGFGDLARSQYGGSTPITAHGSAHRIIGGVMRNEATVGVLPVPGRDDDDPWWPHLLSEERTTPRIIARLPFAGSGNGRGGALEALVISRVPPEETGRDRSYLAIDADAEFSLATLGSALADAGLPVTFTAFWGDEHTQGPWLYLAEVDEFISAKDRRIRRFLDSASQPIKRVIMLGSYAVPLSTAELADAPAPRRKKKAGPEGPRRTARQAGSVGR